MSPRQFRLFVVRPILLRMELWSEAAENLLWGTAVHESGGLRWLDQVTGPNDATPGPARGLYQIEPATLDDLYVNWLAFRPNLRAVLWSFEAPSPRRHEQLATNLGYATAAARLLYLRIREPLPHAEDLEALARYWKTYWNTAAGKGTPAQFVVHYRDAMKAP